MFLDWERDDDADDHVTYRWAVKERALFDSLDEGSVYTEAGLNVRHSGAHRIY